MTLRVVVNQFQNDQKLSENIQQTPEKNFNLYFENSTQKNELDHFIREITETGMRDPLSPKIRQRGGDLQDTIVMDQYPPLKVQRSQTIMGTRHDKFQIHGGDNFVDASFQNLFAGAQSAV